MFPTLLKLGPLSIPSYGFFIALAFLAAILLASRIAKSQGEDPDKIVDLGIWIMISGLVGARLLYVCLEWGYFRDNLWKIIIPPYSGFVYYGGFIGGFLATLYFLWSRKMNTWKTGDILAPAIALGQAIGRWACFFNGCCYGGPVRSNFLPGLVYPTGSDPCLQYGAVPLHPTQIYESLGCLLIFALLLWKEKRKSFDGQLIWGYVVLYGVLRFLLEFLRGDDRGAMVGWVSPSQWISLVLVPLAVVMLIVFGKKARKA